MASKPIVKFRCFRCNKLLGVSRSKVGETVACPTCQADLIVPSPIEAGISVEGVTGPADSAVFPDSGQDLGIPLEILEIRPEDIRAEAGVAWEPQPLSRPDEPPTPFFPVAGPETLIAYQAPKPVDPVIASPPPHAAPAQTLAPSRPASADPVVPPIRLDETRRRGRQAPTVRPRDVVLSHTVIAAWSLFVLLSLAFTFLAGLLAGHFLWKIH